MRDEDPDPRRLLHILIKHRWLVGGFASSVLLVVALVTLLSTPLYTAETLLLIERQPARISDIESVVVAETLSPLENDYHETQFEILRSRSLATQVIEEQDLAELLGAEEDDAGDETAAAKGISPRLVGVYVNEWLEVEPVPGTRLVRITLTTPDPDVSARALTAHVGAYMRQGLALRTLASEEARGFLEDSLTGLKQRVEESEAALNKYRREAGIIAVEGPENITVERLADLNEQLTLAEADRIAREAEVWLIRERDYESLPAVLDSPLITTLKEQLAQLEGEYALLATKFRPEYPRRAQILAQVNESRRRLRQEVQTIVAGIESEYLAALNEETALRAKADEQKTAALELKDASVEYAILEREADTNRQLHDSVLERMKEMGVAAELRASNAFVIDPAYPPGRPSSPKQLLNLALGLLLGLAGGIALALGADYLDNTLGSADDVERFLGLATLGVVPDLARLEASSQPRLSAGRFLAQRASISRARLLLSSTLGRPAPAPPSPTARREVNIQFDPDAAVTEAYRSIRTSLLLSRASEPPRTILFTSATGGEGKTVTALNTAIMFAQLGPPVVLIDADLRRPRCHDGLGVENGAGLTEVLTGRIDTDESLSTAGGALSFLRSGVKPPNPTELLGSGQMRGLLIELRKRFSYVLIDSPPLLPVSDSVVLSQLVDGVVLVIDQPGTPRPMIRQAYAQLASAGAKVLGVVLNRVDPQGPGYSQYGPGYY